MEEPAKINSFAPCVSCGKPTFIDLLDENMKCEYCREQRRTRPSRKKRDDNTKKGKLYETAVEND